MLPKNNAIGLVPTTIEELEISLDENLFIGEADVNCLMEYEGYDAGDYETPPSGGFASMYDIAVQKVYIYTADGEEHSESTDDKHLAMVQKWINDTGWMESNEEWAIEQWGTDVQGNEEAALEAKADAKREEGY